MQHPTIYFIRHGQTDWNAELRLQGQIDIPINDVGRSQARRNGRALQALLENAETFDFIASPLQRTRETMEIVRTELGITPRDYIIDERLKEVSFGSWEGRSWPELIENEPEAIAERGSGTFHFTPPKGESYAELSRRVAEWFTELGRDTIVVSHGGVSRVLRGIVLELADDDVTKLKAPQNKIMQLEKWQVYWH